MEAALLGKRTHQNRREQLLSEQLDAQIEIQRVDHQAWTESDPVKRLAIAARHLGIKCAVELPLRDGFDCEDVDQLIHRRDTARRLARQLLPGRER